jgi:hypothetical protein
MFTVRILGGVALFLMGTTWLWLTPAFATGGVSTAGAMWASTRILCLLTVAGFTVATVGLFARQGWWEAVALGSSVLGVCAVVTYWVAAIAGGESAGTTAWNALVHLVMVAGLSVLLLVPPLERWVDRHVMTG